MKSTKVSLAVLAALLIPCICYAADLFPLKTALDRNWGRSYETAKFHQILNPKAKENLCPITGLEGRAAERIVESYLKGTAKRKSSRKEFGIMTLK